MPIEIGIWKLGQTPARVPSFPMPSEERLEALIAEDISILDPGLLLIGRQVPTSHGTFIDLVAMDADGKLSVIELKRHRTPGEMVAQLLDHGAWVRKLRDDDVAFMFADFLGKYRPHVVGMTIDDAFRERFGVKEIPAPLNERHELLIVASQLDESTERIVNYLSDEYGVAINARIFRFFKQDESEFLSGYDLLKGGRLGSAAT